VSEIAHAVDTVRWRAQAALRKLKASRRVFQGGDRRFARYAGDAATARAASVRVRRG
jgi:hypothetical protein